MLVPGQTRLRTDLPPSLLVSELHLDELDGERVVQTHGPLAPPIRIGSAPGNDVQLGDATVSRHHCVLLRTPSGLTVRDTGSRNGTWIGALRVGEAWLPEGARLRVGGTTLALRVARTRPVDLSLEERFGDLLGRAQPMRELFAVLARLAPREVPVLIEGETGTGKELVARAVHGHSARADGPFVVVDCGVLAPTLVESELFGHVKGAFTGAEATRTGAFEVAERGTLFLDEIGELPLSLQPKLLRVLESGRFKALGSTRERDAAVRVVAATHRDLRRMVNEGTFREDLYYRLAVCPVVVPPLRERLEDLELLARHFLARSLGGAAPALTEGTRALLAAREWPGNVRELRNWVERAVILGDPAAVAAGDLTGALAGVEPRRGFDARLPLAEAKQRFEREYLVELLARHGGDVAAAAIEADVHPKSLARLLRRHAIGR